MVRGRRILKTYKVESEIQSFNTKSESLRKCRKKVILPNEQCITNYFKISEVSKDQLLHFHHPPSPNPIHDDFIMDGDKEFENEKNLTAQVVSSPHRIELRPPVPVNSKPKTESNIKTIRKNNAAADHKLTEYFPVRRSIRKTKQVVQEEKQKHMEKLLKDGTEDGLAVHFFDGKGRGVVTTRSFEKGDFVVEYSGELLDLAQAKIREAKYAKDLNAGCYMYYFKYQDQHLCIDATPESGRLGRLVNHSRNGNLITRTICVDGLPRLILIAKEDIKVGEEVMYDYGDRSKESLINHPWLAF